MITELEFDDDANVVYCLMQAVLTKREFEIDWRTLKSADSWRAGWK